MKKSAYQKSSIRTRYARRWMKRNPAITGTATTVLLLWVLCWLLLQGDDDRGTFGDMFGSVNALFSGFAFLGVVYAILLQREELRLQRQELKETRQQVTRSANAQESSDLAFRRQAAAALISALKTARDVVESERQAFIKKERTAEGESIYGLTQNVIEARNQRLIAYANAINEAEKKLERIGRVLELKMNSLIQEAEWEVIDSIGPAD